MFLYSTISHIVARLSVAMRPMPAWLAVLACCGLLLTSPPVMAEDVDVRIGVGDTVLTVNGRTSPGAFVTVLDNGVILGTTTALSTGDFTHTFTAFTPGVHQISVYARDTQDQMTSPVHQEVNVTEHFPTVVSFFLPPTLAIENSTVPIGTAILMRGSTIPAGEVLILVDDSARETVTAGPDGTWQYVLETGGMAAGNHSVYVIASDPAASEQSYPTAKAPITLIAPESIPPFVTPTRPTAPTITQPTNGSTVGGTDLSVRGRAEPGTRIELYNDSLLIGSTFTNSRGEWEIIIGLNNPSYTLRARACRLLICSSFSQPVTFFWQPTGQFGKGLVIRLERYWFIIPKDSSITHNLHIAGGTLPYSIQMEWGDGSVDKFSGKDTHLALPHTYRAAGQFVGTVTVTDAKSTLVRQTFTVEVVAPASNYALLIIAALLLILALLLFLWWLGIRRRRRKSQEKSKESRR